MLCNDLVTRWRSHVEEELDGVAKGSATQSSSFSQALEYVLLGGGKRVRALLTLALEYDLASDGIKGRSSRKFRALSSAVAVEALHAASLVHDDLPALDNDDMRRGKPSCHRAFGEATAILVGDALVGSALYHVASDEELSSDVRARVGRVLSRVWLDLCVGQHLDISQGSLRAGGSTSQERATMIRLKTGALFGSAVACGAICGGVSEGDVERYFNWGVRVGECFQALDDLDDKERPESERPAIIQQRDDIICDLRRVFQIGDCNVATKTTAVMTDYVVRMILKSAVQEDENGAGAFSHLHHFRSP